MCQARQSGQRDWQLALDQQARHTPRRGGRGKIMTVGEFALEGDEQRAGSQRSRVDRDAVYDAVGTGEMAATTTREAGKREREERVGRQWDTVGVNPSGLPL
jgi:hypothetical protein